MRAGTGLDEISQNFQLGDGRPARPAIFGADPVAVGLGLCTEEPVDPLRLPLRCPYFYSL